MSNGLKRNKNYSLPKNKVTKENASLEFMQEVRFQTHLLPPGLLKEYEQIIPGFAKDIHQEFLTETGDRRSHNRWLVRGTVSSKFLGQFSAFAIAIFLFYIAWDLGLKGHDWLAGIIATVDVAAIVGVFLGVQYFGKEREKQAQQVAEERQSEEEKPAQDE